MKIDNEISYNIWKDRYSKNNETLDENLHRVAKYVSTTAKEEKDFYDVMNQGLFFPAGRTMSNSGIGKNLTLNNCFTAPLIKDDLTDIFDKVSLGARTHQKGGGIGYNFSQLRPKGSPTSNDAIASGAVSFMDVFNAQTATILQGSRRGANMGLMSIYDIDIEDFINAKSYDKGKLIHFNVTVLIDNDFMQAVNNNKKVILHYPVYDENGKLLKDENKWKYKREIDANYLWNLIIKKAYDNGEPGIAFEDTMNKDNNLYYIENITTTNPCFTADMKLLTDKGFIPIGELVNQNFNIINKDGNITKGKVWCSGKKETVIIKLTNNQKIKCTPNHIFMLNDGSECQAKNLKNKRLMPYINRNFIENSLYIKLGFIQGDGCTGRINSEHHQGMEVNIGYHDNDIKTLFKKELVNVTPSAKKRAYYLHGFNDILISLGFDGSQLPERVFPITYNSWDINKKANFLNGCYSANGSIIKHYRISYKTTSKVFALQLKKALEEFNITANITINQPKKVVFNNGEYECKKSYDININKYKDTINFYNNIGFYQKYKMNNLIELIKEKSPMVLSVKQNGVEKVYDFTEPQIHWGIIEGFVVHNCFEYLAGTVYGINPKTKEKLNSNDFGGACNLGSLFLHNMILNPFTNKAQFDYKKLQNTINIAVRLLDNIIDINNFPDKIYENYQKSFRTIGLGFTGLADTLCMLNIKYGSDKSIAFINKLTNFITKSAYKASINLAKEKNEFPFLDRKKFIHSGFIEKHIKIDHEWEDIKNDILKYGIRNSKLISVAPTGTLSLTFGNNCSSGLEPIFSLSFDRKVKIGGQADDNIKIVKMQDYAYKEWNKIKDENNCIVNKDIFVTAMELPIKAHLSVLKTIAFNVDMSCSKTINIPTDYPFEDTKQVYQYCWENNIKGCTIFRPNPIRQGILITKTKEDSVKSISKSEDLPRGYIVNVDDSLIGKKKKVISGCGSLHVEAFFSPDTGDMMEVYLSKGSSGGCNSLLCGLSRMISISLRGGIPIEAIVDQLDSVIACPSYATRTALRHDTSKGKCCPDAVGEALLEMQKEMYEEVNCTEILDNEIKINNVTDNQLTKTELKFIKDNGQIVFAQKFNKCPNCGKKLRQEGGCIVCGDCGWSKCD